MSAAQAASQPSPIVLHREEEVAHYLMRARQRLDSGDVSTALALVDAALGVTMVMRGEGARDR